ncbi:diphthine--ammonia ligase [Candidatus Pacearchaeota archaeon]|nr:diphthine--ammonia ligase [Candidatus Pacearchaeota archaeon]
MKLGVLFSGGKDSTFAAYLVKKNGYKIACLISIVSENKESFMFHTPSISKTSVQSEAMRIPLIVQETKGEKETELMDLKKAIEKAKKEFHIEGIVTGAIESVYQASRVQKICDELNLECFNPLWLRNQFELLQNLIKNKFEVIITGVFAYPLDKTWLGKKIDKKFIEEIKKLNEKYKINPAGEGGEFESFVLNCPLFKKKLKVKSFQDFSAGENSWRRELEIE